MRNPINAILASNLKLKENSKELKSLLDEILYREASRISNEERERINKITKDSEEMT